MIRVVRPEGWPWELVEYEWDESTGEATLGYTNNDTDESKVALRQHRDHWTPKFDRGAR